MATGQDIVTFARTQLGDPYQWGSEGPSAFDCSGLVQYVYKHFGISTPRTTSDMMARKSPLIPIGAADLSPGDLIFSHWGSRGPHSHVAIYAGNGEVIEAPSRGQNVKVTKYGPSYKSHTDALRRVPGIAGAKPVTNPGDDGGLSGLLGPGGAVIAGMIPNPGNITEAATNIGNAIAGFAQSVAGVGELATVVGKAFLPSNMLRAAMFVFGTMFVIVGIWFLAREVKESNP